MNKSALTFEPKRIGIIEPRSITNVVSFEELKTKVLAPKCLSCHAKWQDEAAFQAKHILIGDPDRSKMFDSVKAARMPKGKKLPDGTRTPVEALPAMELELVYNYIQNAKLVLRAPVSFEELKIKVLEPKCMTCHKTWLDEPGFLAKNVIPGKAEMSKMYDSVLKERMPKSPKNPDGTRGKVIPLLPEEQELIKNYINGLKPLSL